MDNMTESSQNTEINMFINKVYAQIDNFRNPPQEDSFVYTLPARNDRRLISLSPKLQYHISSLKIPILSSKLPFSQSYPTSHNCLRFDGNSSYPHPLPLSHLPHMHLSPRVVQTQILPPLFLEFSRSGDESLSRQSS